MSYNNATTPIIPASTPAPSHVEVAAAAVGGALVGRVVWEPVRTAVDEPRRVSV